MIQVELNHDVNLKKAAGVAVILGATIGATIVVTKEGIEYTKKKIKKIKNKNIIQK